MHRIRGFTLIELLVVIGILGLLMVVLLNAIASGQEAADEKACDFNLRQGIYANIKAYEAKKGHLPPGGGRKFLWDLWNEIEHTEKHRDMLFCPEVNKAANTRQETKEIDLDELWRAPEDFTSEDTDYACRSKKYRKTILKGRSAWVADDNEDGSNHRAGTINVLYADGSVKPIRKSDLVKDGMWDEDDPDFFFPVGPESSHKELQKLEK